MQRANLKVMFMLKIYIMKRKRKYGTSKLERIHTMHIRNSLESFTILHFDWKEAKALECITPCLTLTMNKIQMRHKILGFVLVMIKAQKFIKKSLFNLNMRYVITKNTFLDEFAIYKKELVGSPVDADKILQIQLETFDWELTDAFIKRYLLRCRLIGVLQLLKYKNYVMPHEGDKDRERHKRLRKSYEDLTHFMLIKV